MTEDKAINNILDRNLIVGWTDSPLVANLKSYRNDEMIILHLMRDTIRYHSTGFHRYDEKHPYHIEVNNIINQLLLFNNIPINYLEKEKNILGSRQHSPLSFALDHGFYDVVKGLSRRKDLDPNFMYVEIFEEKRVPASLIWNNYDDDMLIHGAYQAFLGVDGLKLNDFEWYKLYHYIMNNYNIHNLDSALATIELLKMLVKKYELPSKLTEIAQGDINNLKKQGISLIKDK